jgi:hypothetical protein
MIYSGANLYDHNILTLGIWYIMYYLLSTFVKILLFATLIPFNVIETEEYNLSQELLKVLVSCIDIIFISYSLKAGKTFTIKEDWLKILSVSSIWVLCESVIPNIFYFVSKAMSEEFSWVYIQSAINSNIILAETIGIVAITSCYINLRDCNKTNIHLLFILYLKYFFSGVGLKHLFHLNDEWFELLAKVIFSLSFLFLSKLISKYYLPTELNEEEEQYSHKKIK